MALQKTKTDARGETISYWRWIDQNRSDLKKTCHYILGGWKDRAERLAYPEQPRETVDFSWSGDDYPFNLTVLNEPNMNDCCVAYTKSKESKLDANRNETNWFADAVDC